MFCQYLPATFRIKRFFHTLIRGGGWDTVGKLLALMGPKLQEVAAAFLLGLTAKEKTSRLFGRILRFPSPGFPFALTLIVNIDVEADKGPTSSPLSMSSH